MGVIPKRETGRKQEDVERKEIKTSKNTMVNSCMHSTLQLGEQCENGTAKSRAEQKQTISRYEQSFNTERDFVGVVGWWCNYLLVIVRQSPFTNLVAVGAPVSGVGIWP